LEDGFERKTGLKVEHVGAGTAEALKLGRTGKFDLVLVHAKSLEEQFVAEGFGTKRVDLMYNDFVIVGSSDDPAGIGGLGSAAEALRQIRRSECLFISRGDYSGTHVKEIELWERAGLTPEGHWYRVYEKGAEGNVKTLLFTDEQNAYTIIDRATFVTTKDRIKLKVLVEKDVELLNFMTLIPVSKEKFPHVNSGKAQQFVEYCTSVEGQLLIRDFGKDIYGVSLFFPNSDSGKSLL